MVARLVLLTGLAALVVALPAPAHAAKPRASASATVKVVKAKRRVLARKGTVRVRLRARRSGPVRLRARLAGVAGPAARAKRVRLRRGARRTVRLKLAAYARSVLGGCGSTRLRVVAKGRRARPARAALAFKPGPGCRPRAHVADGRITDWRGTPTHLAGQSTIDRGELIYTDYLYDDYGADTDGVISNPQFRANLSPRRGNFDYPPIPDRYGHNAADLRELRLAADADQLHLLVGLQTMLARDATAVTLAIDADGEDGTSAPWPDGIGLETKGPERFVTTWGTGARLVTPEGTRTLETATDLEENAIEVDVPLSALGPLESDARVWVVTGLNAGDGAYMEIAGGAPRVFNAGFRRQEEYPRFLGAWNETGQAAALAARDIAPYAHRLDVGRLQAGTSDLPFRPEPGYYNRIFESEQALGEGVDVNANQATPSEQIGGGNQPTFRGRWQPYGLYVPEDYAPGSPNPLLLDLHSLDANHNQYKHSSPNRIQQLGEERGSLVITPLGRGADTWYLEHGFVDTLEAWEDVRRAYDVDAERTALAGYSMGGYGTYRLGLLMPDRFSRASVFVGPPAFQLWPYPLPLQSTPEWEVPGNTNRITENARNLPYEVVHGNADELVPISGVIHQVDTFVGNGSPVRFYQHQADDHLSFVFADQWARTRDHLGDFERAEEPVQVRYRRVPAMDLPKHDLVFDGAYWVDGIEVRDAAEPAASGLVDAVSHGRGGKRPTAQEFGPEPFADQGSPGVVRGLEIVDGDAIEKANVLELRLVNVKALRVELAAAGLTLGVPLEIRVQSDGPARLELGDRTVDLPAGEKTITVG